MPLYYFILKSERDIIPDRDGTELPDLASARAHATSVARDLMRNRELPQRNWRLEVCDDYLVPCFEILFADVDETLAAFHPHLQNSIKETAHIRASLTDAFCQVRNTFAEVEKTLARLDNSLMTASKVTGGGYKTEKGNERSRLGTGRANAR